MTELTTPDVSSARLASTPSAWIIVLTKGMQERPVAERLERKGFEVYLPMRMVQGPKKGTYAAPFFPRTLFVRMALEAERWQSIFTLPGVQRVLATPERPIGVRDDFVQAIRNREIDGYLSLGVVGQAKASKPKPSFRKGQKITDLRQVVDVLFEQWIDEKRGLLLASFASDSSVKITVDLRRQAGR